MARRRDFSLVARTCGDGIVLTRVQVVDTDGIGIFRWRAGAPVDAGVAFLGVGTND